MSFIGLKFSSLWNFSEFHTLLEPTYATYQVMRGGGGGEGGGAGGGWEGGGDGWGSVVFRIVTPGFPLSSNFLSAKQEIPHIHLLANIRARTMCK